MTLVWKCISEITIIQAKIYQMRFVFLQYTTKALLWYNEQCKMGEEVEKHEYLFIFTWSWEPNSYYTMVWFTKYLKKKSIHIWFNHCTESSAKGICIWIANHGITTNNSLQ